MERNTVELAPGLAKLLVQLDNGWLPADFALPGITTIQINQRPWPGSIRGIALDGEALIFRLEVFRKDWQDEPSLHITAQSEEGGKLEAWDSNTSTQYGEPLAITLRCQQWSYTPAEVPLLWVAFLQNVQEVNAPGNLLTHRQEGEAYNSSITGVRLAAEQLAFYVLNTKSPAGIKQVLLALENLTSQPLTSESVGLELPLLRVVLSMPIQPGIFYGLNAEGQTTAALVTAHPQAASPVNGQLSPVPVSYSAVQGRISWIVPFYRKLHRANAATGGVSPVSFSLSRYGHSLAPIDVETQFELVAGAVWILANYLSNTDAQSAESIQLQSLALAALTPEQFPPTTQALEWLVATYGPDGEQVSHELFAAVKELMNGALADYYAANASQQVIRQRYNRVQLLRRAYAVLLSRAIGYNGRVGAFSPLTDQEPRRSWKKSSNDDLQPGWLRAPEDEEEDTVEAHQVFRAKADVSGLSVWPTFELPVLPTDELIRAFSTFAEQVRYQTQGKVSARLRLLPRRDGAPLHLSFRLMVDRAPTTQVALFTFEVLKKGFEVQGWGDKPIRITTPKSLETFQQKLLASSEFKYQVERLLLIEDDIRRGEA
jgi:hypothetical protein